jgi:hypothetical protein
MVKVNEVRCPVKDDGTAFRTGDPRRLFAELAVQAMS